MKIIADTNKVALQDFEALVSGAYRDKTINVELSPEYDGLSVWAIFDRQSVKVEGGKCYTPTLDRGTCSVGIYAVRLNNENEIDLRYSPVPALINIEQGSYSTSINSAAAPTITEAEQIYALIDEAIKAGMLKGEKGEPGEQGPKGDKGETILNIDVVDDFYENEIVSPYVIADDPNYKKLVGGYSSGPYTISSVSDVVKTYTRSEKNTDADRIEITKLMFTADGTENHVIKEKVVCYHNFITTEEFGSPIMGTEYLSLLNDIKTGAEIMENYFAVSYFLSVGIIMIIAVKDLTIVTLPIVETKNPTVYACGNEDTINSLFSLIGLAGNEDDVNIVICDSVEIAGQNYIEHYDEIISNLIEDGNFYTSSFPSSASYPSVLLDREVTSEEDFYSSGGYAPGAYLYMDEEVGLALVNNFHSADLSDKDFTRSMPYGGWIGSGEINIYYQNKVNDDFLYNYTKQTCTENPSYLPFLGWEKIFESTGAQVKYMVPEKDYAKYNYIVIVSSADGSQVRLQVWYKYWKNNEVLSGEDYLYSTNVYRIEFEHEKDFISVNTYNSSNNLITDRKYGQFLTEINFRSNSFTTSGQLGSPITLIVYRKRCA